MELLCSAGFRFASSATGSAQLRPQAFVFLPDLQYFQNIQQIIQGIGPIPELVLLPETGGNRKEQGLIHIHASCRDEAGGTG